MLRKHPQLRTEEDLGLLSGPVEALRVGLVPEEPWSPADLRELGMALKHEMHPAGHVLYDVGKPLT